MPDASPSGSARLIALDWGTSNLRASLLGDGGRVLETRAAAGGVMAVPERRFEAALMALAGDWIEAHRCPVIASGMIGSRQGWREAPYVECPAGLAQVAAQLVRVPLTAGSTLHIVPGLSCIGADGQDDVMRGEETQLWGAALAAGSCCVLPGTHAKWAWMGEGAGVDGAVRAFQTFMTGELYAVLTQHSILGRLMQAGQARPEAFAQGVQLGLAEYANATHVIFAARTAGLMGRIEAEGLPDFLSGLLIGIEIGSATGPALPAAVVLLGDEALCSRYETALDLAGIGHYRASAEATTRGQWRMALAAGLVRATGADAQATT
ncbi:MAG: 2-dehydro-3-deoxygalactonokinase [Burkholderiales bacterium]|nr:2-dehydro-3-deoxygalactonokinase [Burkholderiales bacterium]